MKLLTKQKRNFSNLIVLVSSTKVFIKNIRIGLISMTQKNFKKEALTAFTLSALAACSSIDRHEFETFEDLNAHFTTLAKSALIKNVSKADYVRFENDLSKTEAEELTEVKIEIIYKTALSGFVAATKAEDKKDVTLNLTYNVKNDAAIQTMLTNNTTNMLNKECDILFNGKLTDKVIIIGPQWIKTKANLVYKEVAQVYGCIGTENHANALRTDVDMERFTAEKVTTTFVFAKETAKAYSEASKADLVANEGTQRNIVLKRTKDEVEVSSSNIGSAVHGKTKTAANGRISYDETSPKASETVFFKKD
tara:strand:+ start:306 stop:1229 length:924 start_codon:yes stop_codon:yes gene_type:complete